MLDLGRGVLEEFVSRSCTVAEWVKDDFTVTISNDGSFTRNARQAEYMSRKRRGLDFREKERKYHNARRRAMRKLNPNYGR